MKGALDLTSAGYSMVPLVGRQEEVRSLSYALKSRQSRLIVGPSGIGKTRLLEESLSRSGQPFVRVERPLVLHQLLVCMAEQMSCRSPRFSNLRQATSVHLKPLVLHALRAHPQCVILEDIPSADPRMYRFLQKVYYVPQSCLVVTARSRDSIGQLRKLLWDPSEEIRLRHLTRQESITLFEHACNVFHLEHFDLDDFRRKVIDAAHGNPGQITAMCRLASQPEYRSGSRIKFLPLRMDVLSAFVS